MKLEFSGQIFEKFIKKFYENPSSGVELFCVDREMEIHDETYCPFLQFCEHT